MAYIGRTVTGYTLSGSNIDKIKLETECGPVILRAYGDCCSQSWFDSDDDLDILDQLIGGTLNTIDIENDVVSGLPKPDGAGCITEKRITIAFSINDQDKEIEFYLLNDSNGYYYGWMEIGY